MIINKSKGKSAFKYSVINNSDQSIGVVFEYNNMYQLSFHTFDKKIAKFSYHKPNKKFVKIKIDEFSSSRYIAVKLANIFNIGKLHNWL